MRDDGRQHSWQRTVLVGLGAIGVTAGIVGVVVGLMVVGATSVAGIGETTAGPSQPQSLYMPPYTKTPQIDDTVSEGKAPRPMVSAVPLDPVEGPTSAVGEITLYATPLSVSVGEQINLSGVYLDGDGVALQVQREEGGAWVDFPTTATVRNGGFDTYVYTGRSGENAFRMFDPTTGRSSNSVSVSVG